MRKGIEPTELIAILRHKSSEKSVKVWRYYTIFDFCRDAGCDRAQSNEIAKWCKGKRSIGDEVNLHGIAVKISAMD